MTAEILARQRAYGSRLLSADRTRFRLWAPDSETVSVEFEDRDPVEMQPMDDGWFEAEADVGAGTTYRYRVSPDMTVPDPASDYQQADVHDSSVVVDHGAYPWQNADWMGRPWHEAVIYELHVGALGGFNGVTAELPRLAELGITAVELMPIADFAGQRNWGYDGVLPYAPDTAYGTPDELKLLIDTAHGLGLMVMLDVVYNHFGPDGNYLGAYASGFYRHDRSTPWGDAIDFRREQVQRFFIENAIAWLEDYRFDGLRFDAVHAIGDTDFLQSMAAEIRGAVAPGRHVHLVLENDENDAALLRTAPDRPGFDAQWADDLHHCIHVMLTGETEAYYEDYARHPADLLARCLDEGFAFQGQVSEHTGKRRGTPSTHLPPTCFVICLQNHDQIGNRAFGERLGALAQRQALQAATALLLLTPQIPLLFMGQEWSSTAPFLFFADHHDELAEAVRNGRRKEFARFAAFTDPEKRERIPDPNHPDSFESSRPSIAESEDGDPAEWLALYRRLLAVRKAEIVPRVPGTVSTDAVALGKAAVRARWIMGDGTSLSVAVNLGETEVACPSPVGRILFASRNRIADDRLPPHSAEIALETR